MKLITKIIKLLIFVFGTAATINGIVLFFTTNFNIGNILTLAFGVVLIIFGAFSKEKLRKIPAFLRIVLIFAICVSVVFSGFLTIYGLSDNVDYTEDAIIVLGAGIHGEIPSNTLKQRLNKAVEYYNKNNNAIIVVSGGKGPQEDISEALAMEMYLLERGIPPVAIVKEEESTSTAENFKNSKEKLDSILNDGYKVAFISNEYHIYRAKRIAIKNGFEDIAHTHSSTRWYSVLPGTLRECLAVIKFWIFGN